LMHVATKRITVNREKLMPSRLRASCTADCLGYNVKRSARLKSNKIWPAQGGSSRIVLRELKALK